MNQYILLIDCRDETGLIHKVTGVLLDHNLNIISNAEFVEKKTERFFMRTGFFASGLNEEALCEELRSCLPEGAGIQLNRKEKKKIVILVTKEHHCLSDLLIRSHFNELEASVAAVISNYENLGSFAEKFNIPFHYTGHEGKSREAHEKEIISVIKTYQPHYLVLAKYMRILSPEFIAEFRNRIINIHHSFLPAFAGANPYVQAYERGVKIIGATAHFVTEQLDEGPIISQNVFPVAHSHSATDMSQSGKDVEKIVLAKALKLVLEDRVFVSRNKTIIFD